MMRAVGYTACHPIDHPDALVDLEIERPAPTNRDLLVRILAISVNPVDFKVRRKQAPPPGTTRILGWDAVGEVVDTGADAQLFKPGDRVWYAGSIDRPGTNSEYHLVDERIVGRAPTGIPAAAAAALPLTSLTAYEMLFDRLDVHRPVPGAAQALLLIGAAGGVGSIAIQLTRALTRLEVIATASRPESQAWVRRLGAHHVVDHTASLPPQVAALGLGAPAFVFSTTASGQHADAAAAAIAPQGRYGLIDDPQDFDAKAFKAKSVSIHWELMFTRSRFQTPDMYRQGAILNEIADLVDSGQIRATMSESYGAINAENLRRAHRYLESGAAIGKITLEGFGTS